MKCHTCFGEWHLCACHRQTGVDIVLSEELRNKLIIGSETMHDVFNIFDIVKKAIMRDLEEKEQMYNNESV